MKNWRLHQAMKARGMDTKLLAILIDSSRTHVSQVLNNKPGRGGQTRRKLAEHLTPAELELAGWDRAGNIVPRGTLSQAEDLNLPAASAERREGTNSGQLISAEPDGGRNGTTQSGLEERIRSTLYRGSMGDEDGKKVEQEVTEGTERDILPTCNLAAGRE